MATNNHFNIDAVNVILLEILEDIVVGIMDSAYADETDEYLDRLIFSLLSTIDNTAASGDEETSAESESEELNPIPEEAERKEELDKILEESVSLPGADGLPTGDKSFSAAESELAPIPEPAPLGDHSDQDQEDDDGSNVSEADPD